MKRLVGIPLTASMLVGAAVTFAAIESDEHKAIRETALDYIHGWYDADPARMERALHPDLAKRILMVDPRTKKARIEHMGALELIQHTRARVGKPTPEDQRTAEVTVLDVYGNAASVKAVMHDWIDYLHMSRIDGRWKIVNVLWEFTPEAKKRHGVSEPE